VGLFLNLRAWQVIPSGRIEQDQPTLG
jgi:hypothetical protein